VEGTRLLDGARLSDVPAATLATRQARIAHAWALRDASLLHADSAASSAPVVVTHRDVRDRLQRLAPVFVQGEDVLPLRDADRLYWVVQLYSASDRYPLSQRWQIAGGIYSYFKLAATALVDAQSGRVHLIPVARPDAIARTWMARLPNLFTPVTALPASLVAQLPMPSESATAQIRTFARYGARLDGPVLRHLPDSAFVGGAPAPFVVGEPAGGTKAWSVPLLDAGDQLDGVATVVGGADRVTWWVSAPAPGQRWSALLDRLQATMDSAQAAVPETARREARLTAGRVEPLVTTRGLLLMQTVRWTRGDGSVVIARVGITDGEQIGIGTTIADALAGIGAAVGGPRPRTVPGMAMLEEPVEGAAARLYETMRQAMRRGDWTAFGVAFDSLGRVLGRPPR
jgi:uncharacterized membrane protein (UPF0182 family)